MSACSECCNGCGVVILETQEKVKCAGPCGEVFHKSCVKENEYRSTRGVPKEANTPSKSPLRLQNHPSHVSSEDIIDKIIRESALSDVRVGAQDIKELKKELSELRIQNEVFRVQNDTLVNKVKALEVKVENDNKILDEFKKVLRNLSSNVDRNSKCVSDLEDELREVRNLNAELEGENAGLAVQVRELEVKVHDLERSLKRLTEKSVAGVAPSGERAVALQPPRREGNQLAVPGSSSLLLSVQDLSVALPQQKQRTAVAVLDLYGNLPVTSLSGIGPVYGGRLNQMGYYKVSQLYEQLLALNKNQLLFQSWLKSVCGANSRWSAHCYMDLLRMGR